jgi:general secretion pathway protein D
VVIRDAEQSDALSIDRYDLMRTKQQNLQPAPSAVLKGVNGAPVMPEILKPAPPGNTWAPLTQPPATTAPSVR